MEQNPPREAQVIEIISALGRLAVEGTPLCDVGALIRTLASFVGGIKLPHGLIKYISIACQPQLARCCQIV